MKTWGALFVKEWKDNRYLMGLLLIMLVLLGGYGLFSFDSRFNDGKGMITNFIPFILAFAASFVAPPFFLARSISSEWRSETHYQWFSLPVERWVTVLCKYLVAFCNGVVLVAIAGIYWGMLMVTGFMSEEKLALAKAALSALSVEQWLQLLTEMAIVFAVPTVLYLLLLLAVVTAMEGVKYSVSRYQGVAALAFLAGTVYLYARFYEPITGALGFLGRYDTLTSWAEGSMKGVIEFSHLAYPFLATSALLILGLWLFQKRVEV